MTSFVSMSLKGFRSFPTSRAVEIGELGKLAILIGPNNAGKSNVFRALRWVRHQAVAIDSSKPSMGLDAGGRLVERDFHLLGKHAIEVELRFAKAGLATTLKQLSGDNKTVPLLFTGTMRGFQINAFFDGGRSAPIFNYDSPGSVKVRHNKADGWKPVASARAGSSVANSLIGFLETLGEDWLFVDAFRDALGQKPSNEWVENGSKTVERLRALSDKGGLEWLSVRRDLERWTWS